MKHLQKHNILSELQHGYRKMCSTDTQLLKIINLLATGMENKKQIDVISLDFSRAFDVVPIERLLLKLNYYGIRNLLPWFKDFLTGRTQKVVIDGVKSRLIEVLSGIGQGTCTAGLLFLIFINDLPESVTESFTGLFCDDTLLAKEICNENDTAVLQHDLDKVVEWTNQWGMKFNALKCVVMSVSNKRNVLKNNYHFNTMLPVQCLQRQNHIKYLGTYIDNKLTFKKHIEEKCKSATRILNLLRRNLYFAPRSVKSKAYLACVRPILEYAAACWSPTSESMNQKIEKIQRSAAKFVTNCYPKKGHYDEFSVSSLLRELEWDTLENRRKQIKTIMAYKIINNHLILPSTLLPKERSL